MRRVIEFGGLFLAIGVTYATMSAKIDQLRRDLDTEVAERKAADQTHVRADLFASEIEHLRERLREIRQEISEAKSAIKRFN